MNRISLVLSLEDPPSRWFTTLVGCPSVDGRMSLSWCKKVILLGGSLVVKQICHDTLWFACCRFNDLSMWVVFICFNGNDPTNFGGSLSSLHESWTWQALPMRHHETEELWVGDTKKKIMGIMGCIVGIFAESIDMLARSNWSQNQVFCHHVPH